VNARRKISPSALQEPKLRKLIQASPSSALAENHLLRLLEIDGPKAIARTPALHRAALVRLLGSSSYLSEILFRQGKQWREFFLRQVMIGQKTAPEHWADLETAAKQSRSLEDLCAALRRHKQREYLRVGTRDLMPGTTLEETVRELTALAEASLEAAYRFCRAEVEKDFGPLHLPGTDQPNGFVVLGMGKLGGAEAPS
jgi:glutamate-ammonia-ligase adenylyltransferase